MGVFGFWVCSDPGNERGSPECVTENPIWNLAGNVLFLKLVV